YAEYRRRVRQRPAGAEDADRLSADHNGSVSPNRTRSFARLFWEFLLLLRGHGWAIAFALATLTVATLLHLAPPLATKVVFDNVLTARPLPRWWTQTLHLPTDRFQVLYLIGGFIAGVSILATAIHLSGRWFATKAVNRLQVAIRRRVFAHAV